MNSLFLELPKQVNLPVNILPVTYHQNHNQAMYSPDDLPKTVARTLNQGSTPMSMDFHPVQQTILLGEISIWFLILFPIIVVWLFPNVIQIQGICLQLLMFDSCFCYDLVGTNVGDIGLWDVGTRERLVQKTFKVWELGACSVSLQVMFLLYLLPIFR